MTAKIKICGLTRMEDIQAVNEYRPDYIGFVFAPSKRQVSAGQAARLKDRLADGISAIGVFVNESVEQILALVNDGVINVIQLHGEEDDEMILDLKARTTTPVIRAIRVTSEDDICRSLSIPADYPLYDTYIKGTYGGSGQTFDWSCIPRMNRPYFLAGGLNLENIGQAAQTPAYCLDISSGVETDGRKDPEKIRKIITAVRDM